jgi:predicted acyl esterase
MPQQLFSFLNYYLVIRNLLFVMILMVTFSTTSRAADTYGMDIRPATISMPDGVRLSADLYHPTGGRAGEKYPVLLEYLPYRKHEGRRRNWKTYSATARAG